MRRAILVTLALALSLTACQSPTEPVRAPATAARSEAVTSSAAATPTVAMTAGFKVSDVQEAEKVYREFYSALSAAQRKGGSRTLPPSVSKFLEGPASSYIQALLKSDYDDGARLTSMRDGKLVLSPAEGHQRGDSIVALRACSDGRSLRFVRSDGAVAQGRITLNYAYLHRNSAGQLVIFQTTTSSDVSPCSR